MAAAEEAVFMVAAAAASVAEVEAVFIAAAEVSMVAADLMAVVTAGFVGAASMAARELLVEEITTKAAGWELAAVQPRREVGRRMFVPPSTMANGIRSATQQVPRVPTEGAFPEAWRIQDSLLATPEVPMAVGILLAHLEAFLVSAVDPCAGHPALAGVVMVGEAGGVTVGDAGGAGEVGASASAGRTGEATGDRTGRSAGILGGMALTGLARGRPILTITIRITATTGPTIRRRTDRIHPRIRPQIRPMTATRRQATRPHQTRIIAPTIAPTMMTTISISTLGRAWATTALSRTIGPRSPKLRRTVRLPQLSRRVPQG
jgi:hypothetical protein